MKKAFFVLVLLAFTTSPFAVFSAETIDIGFTVATTGQAARVGLKALQGANIAIEEINSAGGVLGKKLRLIVEDHKCEPTEGINAINKLIFQNKVSALVADTCSSTIVAISETVKNKNIEMPVLSGIVTAPKLTKQGNKWFFRAGQNALMEGPAFVGYWVKNLNTKKISFLAVNDDWGRSTAETYAKVLKDLGGTVVSTDFYNPSDQDFYPYLTKIRGKKPDGIDIIGRPEDGSRINIQMGELGMLDKFAILGSDGQITDDFIKLAGKTAEGMYLMDRYEPVVDTATNKKFVEVYGKATKEQPDQYAQAGYDNIHILGAAIKKAGSTDAGKIREALEKTDYQGLASRIQFDKDRQAHPDLLIVKIQNGVRKVVARVKTTDIDFAK
jgi:branched-chain amino acid transport system substrate-binding protein